MPVPTVSPRPARRLLLPAILLPAILLLSGCEFKFDVIIEGGTVVDGTGGPAFDADVGIIDGFIVEVGDLQGRPALKRIDAEGLVVAPGFIDVHSHAGPGLATPELAAAIPLLTQGITTVFVNPDGGGEVDLVAQRAAFGEQRLGVNVALLVPHGSVRRMVMGTEDRPPNPAEMDSMRALVEEGMSEGAFGLSSGLFYVPGSFAEIEEVVELARVIQPHEGVYTSHIRDESNYSIGVEAAVDEVIRVAREAGVTGVVTHIKALGPPVWGYSSSLIDRIEAARAEGVDVWADQYPYEASATGLRAALVSRPFLSGGVDSLWARFGRDPGAVQADIEANLARRGGADRIQFRYYQPDSSIEGRTLADVAAARLSDPVTTALSLMRAGSAGIVSHNMQRSDVEALMRRPWVMTSSDGGLVPMGDGVPHPRNYGSFPRKLALYVRDRAVLSLEEAVHSMTGLPAQVMGLALKGAIHSGSEADLVVFDPESIIDRATFTDPHQLSEGVRWVLIRGKPALAEGEVQPDRQGRVLRRPVRMQLLLTPDDPSPEAKSGAEES